MAHEVETMFSAGRITPWHGLGKIIVDAPDSEAAIKLAGLDWDVKKRDIHVEGRLVDGYKANVRGDNNEVLGIVTDRYQIVQNAEAFAFTDALIEEGEVRYETAGSLKNGKHIWILAKMNRDYDILGDKFDPYMCFTNAHDGTGAVRALMTPVRVVCQNTLNLALRGSTRAWGSKHVGEIAGKLKEAQRTLGLAVNYMEGLNESANRLVDIRMTKGNVSELLNDLFPSSVTDSDRKIKNVMEKREGLLKAMKMDDLKRFSGTGWQVINAVTDFLQHSEPARRTDTYRENQFASTIIGDTTLDKAYQFLQKIA